MLPLYWRINMKDIVLDFIIQKTLESICKEHDWNIEVVQKSTKNFYSAKEQDPWSKRWEDTTFKVSFPNTIQVVDLEFQGLYWDHGTGWRDVGISLENSVHENCFYQIAHLVSMTPVFLETLKKGLKLWGEVLTNETDSIMRMEKGSKELQDFREQIKAKRAKVDARDPELAPYYEPSSRLECQEFLLGNIFPEN
jgi:hypothetical protein